MAETVLLPSKLDIKAAPGLMEALKVVEDDLVLDAASVTHVGTQCLQILLSAKKKLVAQNNAFRIENGTSDFTDQIELFGFDPTTLTEIAT